MSVALFDRVFPEVLAGTGVRRRLPMTNEKWSRAAAAGVGKANLR